MHSVFPLGHNPAGPLIGVEAIGLGLIVLLTIFALILYMYKRGG